MSQMRRTVSCQAGPGFDEVVGDGHPWSVGSRGSRGSFWQKLDVSQDMMVSSRVSLVVIESYQKVERLLEKFASCSIVFLDSLLT